MCLNGGTGTEVKKVGIYNFGYDNEKKSMIGG